MPLTAENTALVFDSTADIPDPESLHPNWRMVPLVVRFGDEALRDHVEITPAEFYRRLGAASELPTTAAPAPGAWADVYGTLAGFERVYVLPIPRRLSASAQSAEVAARELDPDGERITVLDGRTASVGTAVLGEALQDVLARGTTHEEVLAWYDGASARARLVFSLETLEYLVRGGRIGRAQALVGSVLGVHPLLTLTDGEVWPYKKVRGRSRVLREFERFLTERVGEGEPARLGIAHAVNDGAADALREMAARVRPRARLERVSEIGPVLGTYAGPGAYGLLVLPEG